jgi:alpha-L-fucosidase
MLAPASKPAPWWNEAKFGMFIHWGVYAVPADNGTADGGRAIAEWHLSNRRMQIADYERYAADFNPMMFNAREWVRTAKEAGMRYIVITTKHHDGFCMWPTKLTKWSIAGASPFKRDPLKELADECRRQGLRLGFYHSIMDWHHPDYLPRRPWETRSADGADLNRYIDTMKGQLTELLTAYGPIAVLWWDGGWEHNATTLRSQEVNALVRKLQPGIVINDRNALPEDFSTPEQTIPARALPASRPWETCMTMNDTWGFAKDDHNWKSPEDLIRKLCDIASKGGNFLLNVGPKATGEFPEESISRLKEVGKWMRSNGRAIYGSQAGPFTRYSFNGRVSRNGRRLHVYVFDWPAENRLELTGLQTPIVSAKTLLGEPVKVQGNSLLGRPIRLDPAATVVELILAGDPVVEATRIVADIAGNLALPAAEAEVDGTTARYEQGFERDNIGYWLNASDSVFWDIRLAAPTAFTVHLQLACQDDDAGSTFEVLGLQGTVPATGGWGAFREIEVGRIHLAAGDHRVRVKPVRMARGAMMNLRRVILRRSD